MAADVARIKPRVVDEESLNRYRLNREDAYTTAWSAGCEYGENLQKHRAFLAGMGTALVIAIVVVCIAMLAGCASVDEPPLAAQVRTLNSGPLDDAIRAARPGEPRSR